MTEGPNPPSTRGADRAKVPRRTLITVPAARHALEEITAPTRADPDCPEFPVIADRVDGVGTADGFGSRPRDSPM
ncbi:hypothetical protein GCM10020295_03680 [Streptomyces cinereospinus]